MQCGIIICDPPAILKQSLYSVQGCKELLVGSLIGQLAGRKACLVGAVSYVIIHPAVDVIQLRQLLWLLWNEWKRLWPVHHLHQDTGLLTMSIPHVASMQGLLYT